MFGKKKRGLTLHISHNGRISIDPEELIRTPGFQAMNEAMQEALDEKACQRFFL